MVIAIHSAPFENWNEDLYSCIQNVCTFAVPFFFAISGFYFLNYTIEKAEKQKKSVLHLTKVYVFWSAIYFVLAFIKWGYKGIIHYIKESIVDFFVVGSYYHLWFVPVLIYAMIVFCLIYKMFGRKGLLVAELVFMAVGIVILNLGVEITWAPDSVTTFIGNFAKALMCFSMGGIVSNIVRKNKKNTFVITSALSIVLCYVVNKIVNVNFVNSAIHSFKLNLYVLLVILLALKYPIHVSNSKLVDWMAPTSRFSYYSHELFLQLYRLVLVLAPLYLQNTILFVVTVGTTTGITLLLYRNKTKVIQKFFE